jgi:hypothetical protein
MSDRERDGHMEPKNDLPTIYIFRLRTWATSIHLFSLILTNFLSVAIGSPGILYMLSKYCGYIVAVHQKRIDTVTNFPRPSNVRPLPQSPFFCSQISASVIPPQNNIKSNSISFHRKSPRDFVSTFLYSFRHPETRFRPRQIPRCPNKSSRPKPNRRSLSLESKVPASPR